MMHGQTQIKFIKLDFTKTVAMVGVGDSSNKIRFVIRHGSPLFYYYIYYDKDDKTITSYLYKEKIKKNTG